MENNGYEIFGDKTNNDIGFAADPVVRGMGGVVVNWGRGVVVQGSRRLI